MKVFLSADMEGTCGIVSWPETERTTPFDYSPAQKQMTREVAAACQGALSAGAAEVLVKDAHDSARTSPGHPHEPQLVWRPLKHDEWSESGKI